jgi:hypothetical protein
MVRREWRVIIPLVVFSLLFSLYAFSGNKEVVYPEPSDDVLFNPMTGYAPWAAFHDEGAGNDHTLVYADLTWRDWEPKPGAFDLRALKKGITFISGAVRGKGSFSGLCATCPVTRITWIFRIGCTN